MMLTDDWLLRQRRGKYADFKGLTYYVFASEGFLVTKKFEHDWLSLSNP
jgi:hypothetical protein